MLMWLGFHQLELWYLWLPYLTLKSTKMDVKIAFLNGYLDEEVYMEQLKWFIISGQENKVCKLVKYLYGLKQAPKQWA
jgi:hypothetical protein